jgi:hypothetical protein
MGHTAVTQFPDPLSEDYNQITVADYTLVKETFTENVNSGWRRYDFDTPFTYNGTSTLLISWYNGDGSWSSGYEHRLFE